MCCNLAQYPRTRSQLIPAPGPPAAREMRDGPSRLFVQTWEEVIGFDVTVGPTSTESHASKNLYGPFRLDRVSGRCGTAATDSMRLFIGADADDGTTFGELDLGNAASGGIITDQAARFTTGYDLTTLFTSFAVGTIFCHGLTRLLLVFTNTSAGAQVAVGNLHLTHLVWNTDEPY